MKIKSLHVCKMNDDYSYQTRTLNGHKGIVKCHNETFELADLEKIISEAVKIERCKYGFEVFYTERGQLKMVHTRDDGEHQNETTKSKETALAHARKIYAPLIKTEQIRLF